MTTLPIQDFEQRYAQDADPWGFAWRWYEARKYALTLAALPRRHYQRVFEPGCSIGVLSAQLADRCDYLLAADGVEAALEQARARLEDRNHVELARLVLPHQWPDGPWDLVVLSEVGYYFSVEDLAIVLDRAAQTMVAEATLVAVHWRGTTDYPLTGDAVHQAMDGHRAFEHDGGYCETRFRLDVYRRRPG